jgi:hypothetical protein
MTSAPDEIDQRMIHYKHCDANFYQTGAFNIGRLISTIPQVRSIVKQCTRMPLHFETLLCIGHVDTYDVLFLPLHVAID